MSSFSCLSFNFLSRLRVVLLVTHCWQLLDYPWPKSVGSRPWLSLRIAWGAFNWRSGHKPRPNKSESLEVGPRQLLDFKSAQVISKEAKPENQWPRSFGLSNSRKVRWETWNGPLEKISGEGHICYESQLKGFSCHLLQVSTQLTGIQRASVQVVGLGKRSNAKGHRKPPVDHSLQ